MAMALFNFKSESAPRARNAEVEAFLAGYSIEVMPRTAEKVEDFRAILPSGTRVYVAHIEGTPIEDMVATAARIVGEGFTVMPHFPARIIKDRATLGDWAQRYKDVGVREGLLLAGGVPTPVGDYATSMQLLESGAFDGFDRLNVAGHPEGNKDIDPDGSDRAVMEAARWKYAFSQRTDAKMAMATQFCFEAQPVIEWVQRLSDEGVGLPVHIGIAGPAKLQTLIKFAIACGVGASLRVLQKRAMDVTKLLLPYNPDDIIAGLAAHKAKNPNFAIEQVHFFPLGGIKTNATWAAENGGPACQPAV
jgi:methylenetetrahydrofolate reductase (NADPH)